MPDKTDVILSAPCFWSLKPSELDQVRAASFIQDIKPGTILQEAGEVPRSLFIVASGAVEAMAYDDAQVDTIAILNPGAVFTLSAVVADRPALISARTVPLSRIVMMPASLIRRLLRSNHEFSLAVLDLMALQSRCAVRRLHMQKMRTTQERAALWFLDNVDGAGNVRIPFERKTLASLLGTSPENLARALTSLEPAVSRTGPTTYRVIDMPALVAIARPGPLVRLHEDMNSLVPTP